MYNGEKYFDIGLALLCGYLTDLCLAGCFPKEAIEAISNYANHANANETVRLDEGKLTMENIEDKEVRVTISIPLYMRDGLK